MRLLSYRSFLSVLPYFKLFDIANSVCCWSHCSWLSVFLAAQPKVESGQSVEKRSLNETDGTQLTHL